MSVELTLSIIKPDATAKNIIGEIYSRFEKNSLKIVAAKMLHLSKKQAQDFLDETKASIKIELSKQQTPPNWHKTGEQHGYKYDITISREGKDDWTFNFWDSIHNAERLDFLKRDAQPFGREFRDQITGEYVKAMKLLRDKRNGELEPDNYAILACLTSSITSGSRLEFSKSTKSSEPSPTCDIITTSFLKLLK